VLTGVQMAVYKLTGGGTSAAPGDVGKRVVEGVLQQPVAEEHMPQIAQGVHWGYGSAWGAVHDLAETIAQSAPVHVTAEDDLPELGGVAAPARYEPGT
jgi:hypothetical protein